MSLIGFHRFLISAGILFCAGFSVWELRRYARESAGSALVLGILFAVLAVALVFYLSRLRRILGYRD